MATLAQRKLVALIASEDMGDAQALANFCSAINDEPVTAELIAEFTELLAEDPK